MELVLAFSLMLMSLGDCSKEDLSQWRKTPEPVPRPSKLRLFSSLSLSRKRDPANYSTGTDCECGITASERKTRIINGTETEPNEYPWIVYVDTLLYTGVGFIITNSHVITAAHATVGSKSEDIDIYVGKHNVKDLEDTTGKIYYIAKFYRHRKYKSYQFFFFPIPPRNDIAILVTENKIKFNPKVAPACLPSHQFELEGQLLKAMGWGQTKDTGDRDVLREIDMPVYPLEECNVFWKKIKKNKYICTKTEDKNVYAGDSGGAVVYFNPDNRRYIAVGVLSFGHPDNTSWPSISTNVYAYMDWIIATISRSKKEGEICTGD